MATEQPRRHLEKVEPGMRLIMDARELGRLFDALRERGYSLFGPTVRDGTVVLDEIHTPADLPAGWTDRQEGGIYRLERQGGEAFFGFHNGPHSWKKYLHPPMLRLWHASREGAGWTVEEDLPKNTRRAFIGVRSCDLHAIEVQDRVFLGDHYVDPQYKARREDAFIVAVNCTSAGATCFCASTGSGPEARSGFDLSLTEVVVPQEGAPQHEGSHYFLVAVGSRAGAFIMEDVPHRIPSGQEIEHAEALVAQAVEQMGRTLDTEGLKELLYAAAESPRWDEVAKRCLSCGNCTLVCPTCFCTSVQDASDLSGNEAERWRRWDSCFTLDFSYIHGGSVRQSPRARYRQWLTHKLASWQDQFGTLGCVGCGRCITWCPVGIDITEEAAAIRQEAALKEEAVLVPAGG